MRITGGFLGNRRIDVPDRGVRPTQDRVRQALFSSLAPRLADALFLDLCAGSGGVGIEAWSRGAAQVWWVERHPATYQLMKRNIETLCGSVQAAHGALRLFRDDALRFARQYAFECSFDIIFSDPPYEEADGDGAWSAALMEAVRRNGLLKAGGVFVMEQSVRRPVGAYPGWRLQAEKAYGETVLALYGADAPGDSTT